MPLYSFRLCRAFLEEGVRFKIFMEPTNVLLEVQPYIFIFDIAPFGAFFLPFLGHLGLFWGLG